MAATPMARRKRASGMLHQRVLQLLEARYPHPLTGLQLVELLHEEGDLVPTSQVYRALKRLIDEGAACKVLVAGGYVPIGRKPVILLWCRKCGTVEAVSGAETFRLLEARADAAGLTAARSLVEVPGICAACAGRNSG